MRELIEEFNKKAELFNANLSKEIGRQEFSKTTAEMCLGLRGILYDIYKKFPRGVRE